MQLSGLSLFHFRNYLNQTFLFKKPLTIIIAPNASGKTNILEAIHLLATGESFRSGTVDDFIQVDQELGRIKVKAETAFQVSSIHYPLSTKDTHLPLGERKSSDNVTGEGETFELELLLNHGIVSGKRVSKKIFSLNGVRKQKRGVVGKLPTVSFIPEDLRLITGSPSRRRGFLDTVITQIDQQYLTSLTTYEQTLRRRNKLLQQIRDGFAPRTALGYWDMSLIKHGEYIQKVRADTLAFFNSIDFPLKFRVEYEQSVMSRQRLDQYSVQEVASGHTLVGPHKDDISVHYPLSTIHYPLFTHGSRGQQRMGVLWLKLGAFELLKKKHGYPPLLLLDDIFSELDAKNRHRVLEIAKTTQTIMTSAEEEIPDMEELKDADIIRL